MRLNLLDPVSDVVEGLLIRAVVNKDNSHGALVVCLGDSSEPFLAGCVPDLQFHDLIVDIDRFDFEVDS